MSPLKLVINADDAGLDPDADAIILRCAAQGIVTSASVVAGSPHAEAFLREAAAVGLGIGLHLNLSEGEPLAGEAPGLCDEGGCFLGKQEIWRRLIAGEVSAEVLRREVEAQWKWLRERAAIDHLDGHNHVHVLPAVAAQLGFLDAKHFVRRPRQPRCPEGELPDLPHELVSYAEETTRDRHCVDAFFGFRFSRDPTLSCLRRALEGCEGASAEFMVHPGRRENGSLFMRSPLRAREAELLASAEARALLDELEVSLVRFRDLS